MVQGVRVSIASSTRPRWDTDDGDNPAEKGDGLQQAGDDMADHGGSF